MSQENVEIVQRAFEAFRRRDDEAIFALYDADVEIDSDAGGEGLGETAVHGVAGVQGWLRDWLGIFESMEVSVEEWIDAGDHVIAIMHVSGRGRQSGVPVENREAHVWTVRSGKMTRLRIYPSRAQALEAVGLPE